jgi:choline-sulfatase/uncharacterized sulfatase
MKKSNNPPNILLLYSDQHNARTLGCYGNDEVQTPNLDKLANEGLYFNNAYTQNPICTPSRMCILSGQYPHNFGSYGLMGKAPDNLPNVFSHLKKQGYTTGMAGKTHIPTGWVMDSCDFLGDGYGFERPVTEKNFEESEGCQGVTSDDYSQYLLDKGLLQDRDDKILHEWYEMHKHNSGQGIDARPSKLSKDDTIEAWSAQKAIEFINRANNKKQPFFFWMTVPRPHQTYAPAKEFWELYNENDLTLPPNSEDRLESRHKNSKKMQTYFQESEDWRIFDPKDWDSARRRVLKGYYAAVSQMDDAMGRVINHLKELGQLENTIIVYTSDHGEFAGEHGMLEKAPGIGFRCVTRVPLIYSWKGHLEEKQVRDALVESIDFLPTVCALAGLEPPDWVDGKNIKKIFETDEELRDIAVTENPYTKTIHTKKYKFTQYLPEMQDGEDFGELYDIQNDPWEENNLYFDSNFQEVIHDLRYKLYCWLVRTTRNITINTQAPSKDWSSMWSRPWEIADEMYSEDGKLNNKVLKKYLKKGVTNYL